MCVEGGGGGQVSNFSPNKAFCLKYEASVNIGSGEGYPGCQRLF